MSSAALTRLLRAVSNADTINFSLFPTSGPLVACLQRYESSTSILFLSHGILSSGAICIMKPRPRPRAPLAHLALLLITLEAGWIVSSGEFRFLRGVWESLTNLCVEVNSFFLSQKLVIFQSWWPRAHLLIEICPKNAIKTHIQQNSPAQSSAKGSISSLWWPLWPASFGTTNNNAPDSLFSTEGSALFDAMPSLWKNMSEERRAEVWEILGVRRIWLNWLKKAWVT